MLVGLSIRNVVLIEQLSLTFAAGLSALTGETGAGKSILLDALGLALGARGDAGLVRHGSETATVSAEFAIAGDHPARAALAEQGLDAEEALVLRRSLGADGRSRAFVNDQPVSVGLLRQLGSALIEVHGQFESQGLLDPRTHRDVLDAYGRHDGLLAQVGSAWAAWRQAARLRGEAMAEAERARAEEGFLRHAVEELDGLGPQPGEEGRLAEQRSLMQHRERVLEAATGALLELSGDRGAERALAVAQRALQRVADKAGGRFDAVLDALGRATGEVAEAAAALDRVSADTDLDAGALERLEERLFALRALARKHGVAVDGLADLRRDFAGRLALIEDRDERLSGLAKEESAARRGYGEAAEAISTARGRAARALDAAVARELPPLKLDRARFETGVARLEEGEWGPAGIDRVGFSVAVNPGSPPGPLNKIASGGELARFMLALKVVLAQNRPQPGATPTLVFDEVDSGIGGAVADAVGERLKRLGGDVQVLVVTHSPQVAARADHHWRVEKSGGRASVATTVVPLNEKTRREEIARMLSGARVTPEARAAADSLIGGRLL